MSVISNEIAMELLVAAVALVERRTGATAWATAWATAVLTVAMAVTTAVVEVETGE